MFYLNQKVKIMGDDGILYTGIISQILSNGNYNVKLDTFADILQNINPENIILTQFYDKPNDFNFAIHMLHYYESNKKWAMTGDYKGTCGYTAPGIGLILLLFEHYNIRDYNTLNIFLELKNGETRWLHEYDSNMFGHIINETIATFLDLTGYNPITGINQGIMGMIQGSESVEISNMRYDAMAVVDNAIISRVNDNNLREGVNIISFKNRIHGGSTFHHSAIYTIPRENRCFILDSWYDNTSRTCRPLSYRQFTFEEVKNALLELNSDTIYPDRMSEIFSYYFMAPSNFTDMIGQGVGLIYVYTLDISYMIEVYNKCEYSIMIEGQYKSHTGGKKKYKKTRLRRNKQNFSKKYKKTRVRRRRR